MKTQDPAKEARAIVRYLRISPRKVRLVTQAIARKPVAQAFGALTALNKKAARLVEKGLKSAVSNALVKGLEESRLVVSQIKADGGPVMKRFMARSMGRADQILKRSTHLTIVLEEGLKTFGPSSLPPAEQGKAKRVKPKKEKVAAAGAKGQKAKAAAAGA
jgi:large subunit ribosomal protein L22